MMRPLLLTRQRHFVLRSTARARAVVGRVDRAFAVSAAAFSAQLARAGYGSVVGRLIVGVVVLSVAALLLSFIAVSIGPYEIPLSHVWSVFMDWLGAGAGSATTTEKAIIETIRLPRILLALGAGAALAVAGSALQGVFRNPMADPGIVGVSAGASLGAVIAIATGAAAAIAMALPAMAFVGAACVLMVVYLLSAFGGRASLASLLLTGVAVSSFTSAVVSAVIILTGDQQVQREMVFWLAGGLDSTGWADVGLALPLIVAGSLVAFAFARDLNLMLIGEDDARSLGVRVGLVRNVLLVCASLITGAAVAFSGTIAFVGLVAPHAVRLVVGPDHRVQMPLSALAGGVFLLAADTISRTVASPAEIRVGIVTALAGAPLFVLLLIKNKAKAGHI